MCAASAKLFEHRFLDAEPNEEGGVWPKDVAKEDFENALREKLEDTDLIWVNPVAQFVFVHPATLWHKGAGQVSWDDYIKMFLYKPVAINSALQTKLDEAYEPILDPKNKGLGHLTPFFSSRELEETLCFRCEPLHINEPCGELPKRSEEPCINIYQCKQDGEYLLETIRKASTYQGLFDLSNSVIWFLPAPLHTLKAARSALHDQYLVGAYLAFHPSSTCACELWKNGGKIRDAINWATNLFFLRRLKDQGNELRKILEQYAKQMHMLGILEEPLGKLSAALDATQEHSQKLRAILYDPSRAIFSVAPRAWRYFEEGRAISVGSSIRWDGLHEPGSATDDHAREVRLTLAAIICEIFGQIEPSPKNEDELIERAIGLLRGGDPAFEQLRTICNTILDHCGCWKDRSAFMALKNAAQRFKDVLYRPYKDGDGKRPITPLYVAVYGACPSAVFRISSNSKITLNAKELRTALKRTNVGGFLVSLPVTRYAHWLSLVLGLIAYAKAEKKATVNSVTITTTAGSSKVAITFSDVVFDVTKLGDLYGDMARRLGKQEESLSALGNFKKPFLDFVQIADGTVKSYDDGFCVEHKGLDSQCAEKIFHTKISMSTTCFEYSCEEILMQGECNAN